MSETTTVKIAHKVNRLIDVTVEIEPGYIPYYARGDINERHEFLKKWSKEMMEFFRDHRHQDVNSIHAIPKHEDQCSVCGCEWETDTDESGIEICASCESPIEK